MAGISDIRHELCLGLALWNGAGPDPQGADVRPRPGRRATTVRTPRSTGGTSRACPATHCCSGGTTTRRPRSPTTGSSHHGRGAGDPELELLDTGVFDEDRYWSVDVTYAKASPTDDADADRRGEPRPEEATLDVLPTLWFRNTWSWDAAQPRPRIGGDGDGRRRRRPPAGRLPAGCGARARRPAPEALFCDNETNAPRVFGAEPTTPYPKDGINDHVVSAGGDGEPRRLRHQGGVAVPAHRARRRDGRAAAAAAPPGGAATDCRRPGPERRSTRSSATASAMPTSSTRRWLRRAPTPEQMRVLRQACAGLVWSKQIYPYNVARWLDGDPGQPTPPGGAPSRAQRRLAPPGLLRRAGDARPVGVPVVRGLGSRRSTPSRGRTSIPAFAKYQMLVLLREWFQHPNGALPAYEWNFDDVNPPVHVLAALRVFVDRRRRATASSSSASSRSC